MLAGSGWSVLCCLMVTGCGETKGMGSGEDTYQRTFASPSGALAG